MFCDYITSLAQIRRTDKQNRAEKITEKYFINLDFDDRLFTCHLSHLI